MLAFSSPAVANIIGPLNHVAIAVPDLDLAMRRYRDDFGAIIGDPIDLPEHGVTVVFVECGNTRLELLHPLGDVSPITGFLKRHRDGGIHHICHEVADLDVAQRVLQQNNIRILGDGKPRLGAHGTPVFFLHPKDCHGVLIELEQTPK